VIIIQAIQTRRDDPVQDRTSKTPAEREDAVSEERFGQNAEFDEADVPGSGYAPHDRLTLEE
jgi:hypothetical protein